MSFFRPVRWDGPIVVLCYACAFLVCFSPLLPIELNFTELYIATAIGGTPLAVLGVWLNHRAENDVKNP